MAPKFLEKPSIQMEGGKAVMSVLVQAKPEPSAIWYHGTTQLSSSGRINILKQKGTVADSYRLVCELSVSRYLYYKFS